MVGDLKLGFAGPQGKCNRVSSLLSLRRRGDSDGLPSGGLRLGIINIGVLRRIEFEIRIVHLGTRRAGGIVHRKYPSNTELPLRSLQIHQVSDGLYTFDL